MRSLTLARALETKRARALTVIAVCVSLTGIGCGGAYLGGALSKSMATAEQGRRLAPVAEARFANDALASASGADPSALAIAERHDPYTVAGAAARDRQSELIAARLFVGDEMVRAPQALGLNLAGLRKASFEISPAAKPFRLGAALDATRDLDCLTQAVYFEARGEGQSGMQAVAQVVLNRVRHPAFPKTVCGVVFQGAAGGGCQFSFACDGSMHRAVEGAAWRRSRDIAAKALSGYVMTAVGNATHFHTIDVNPGWRASMLRVAQVGTQIFYRFGGPGGGSSAFAYAPKPSLAAEPVKPVTEVASLAPAPVVQAVATYTILHKDDAAADAKPAAKAEAPAPKVEAPADKVAAPAGT
ncbi:MAG TPA: cell wall hydrolase [Caulobacteraceae bacterium]|nr:cell wall hydrolase [Caulobacteraceae bacterium]